MDFLAGNVAKNFPECLEFCKEFECVEDASRVDMQYIRDCLSDVKYNMGIIEKEIDRNQKIIKHKDDRYFYISLFRKFFIFWICISFYQFHLNDTFFPTFINRFVAYMTEFCRNAKSEHNIMSSTFHEVESLYEELETYLTFDKKQYPLHSLMDDIKTFTSQFQVQPGNLIRIFSQFMARIKNNLKVSKLLRYSH